MRKTFRFRIYPSKKQKLRIGGRMRLIKNLYNHLLEKAIEKYKSEGKTLTKYDMNKHITEFKKRHPEYKYVHSQVLQNVSDRLSKAFSNFFKRVKRKKAGERIQVGFPRFKKYVRSLTYPQSGFELSEENKLHLSKIGNIPTILHRPINGKIKILTIKRTNSGRWFATLCCDVDERDGIQSHTNARIGIDVGIKNFATLSDGEIIENPRFIIKSEKKLQQLQRRLSKKKKKSSNRGKARMKVSRLHERTADQRNDFLHKLSRRLTDEYSFIAVEKLNISGMLRNHHLARHISDASWNQFMQMLSYKASSAGRQFVCVDPRGTSQECSGCGHIVKKTLSVRTHSCPSCGLTLDRDHNAAINILKRAERKLRSTAGRAGIQACAISPKRNTPLFHNTEKDGGDQASTLSQDRASRIYESGTISDIKLHSEA